MAINRNDFDYLLRCPLAASGIIGRYTGVPYRRYPVRVLFNDSRTCRTVAVKIVNVIARTTWEAANHVRDEYLSRPETEIVAYGPRGGEVRRYIGWESSIGSQILGGSRERQQRLTGLEDV